MYPFHELYADGLQTFQYNIRNISGHLKQLLSAFQANENTSFLVD